MNLRVSVLFLGIFLSKPCLAIDQNNDFAVDGLGGEVCSEYLVSTQNTERFSIWLDGYLSGNNKLKENVFDLTTWQSSKFLVAVIKNICDRTETLRLIDASEILIANLNKVALHSKEKLRKFNFAGNEKLLYESDLEKITLLLSSKGFLTDIGNENAIIPAIKKFQQEIGLRPTGFPDDATINQLFNN